MSPKHSPRKALVVFTPEAEQQVSSLEPKELEKLDRALDVISVDPSVGAPMPASPVLREYREDTGARVIYYATALGSVIVVAYVEA
jgi:hypothetical protein